MDERDRDGQPLPFSIEFVTCDDERGTGGELIRVEHAVVKHVQMQRQKEVLQEKAGANFPRVFTPVFKKQYKNIRICGTNNKRKVHLRLITEFNNEEVYY